MVLKKIQYFCILLRFNNIVTTYQVHAAHMSVQADFQ